MMRSAWSAMLRGKPYGMTRRFSPLVTAMFNPRYTAPLQPVPRASLTHHLSSSSVVPYTAPMSTMSEMRRVQQLQEKADRDINRYNGPLQASVLRELNRAKLHRAVIDRFESQRYSMNSHAAKEYEAARQAVGGAGRGFDMFAGLRQNSPMGSGSGSSLAPNTFKLNLDEPIPVTKSERFTFTRALYFLFQVAVIGGCYVLLTMYMGKGGGASSMLPFSSTAHSRAEHPTTKFSDVLGIDEVKQEVEEVVEYLKNPNKFKNFGAKLPKGVLLYGPPGTGKTYVLTQMPLKKKKDAERAIAGEAGVPFYFASGSQFDEVFVGVGQKRIRALFEEAKKNKPCIIFIDELDSLGGKRQGLTTAYKDQTLNQLLTELDGFEESTGVVLIAATNQPDLLDSALTRPGRIDKKVAVHPPDIKGREQIIELYLGKTKCDSSVDITKLGRSTMGMTGADLQNMVNLAAIKAVTRKMPAVTQPLLQEALDDILMGVERKYFAATPKARLATAHHEVGHALISILLQGTDKLRKITIIPRGQALGVTSFLEKQDAESYSYKELREQLAIALGGRAAEELMYGKEGVSTGASNDFQQATNIAYQMVSSFGMSEGVGKINFSNKNEMSENTKREIEKEVTRIIAEEYERAMQLLQEHKAQFDLIVAALLENETLLGDDVDVLLKTGKMPARS